MHSCGGPGGSDGGYPASAGDVVAELGCGVVVGAQDQRGPVRLPGIDADDVVLLHGEQPAEWRPEELHLGGLEQ